MLEAIRNFIWGPPLLMLILGTGLYLTVRLRAIQFRCLGKALLLIFKPSRGEGDISPFQALMTALAATIGIGNIAGVATALAIGGVGALFWMIVAALIGMATIYTESFLAVHFRTKDKRGEMAGGPMYTIEKGLGWKWLAIVFAVAGAIAALATGNMVQANSIADILPFETWQTGLALSIVVGCVLIGGIRSIGRVTGILVPFMAILYLLGGVAVLVLNYEKLPEAVMSILSSAFTGQAAVGGFTGSTLLIALRMGVARGLFASEAGLGSSSIAAAAARTEKPSNQALITMTGAFLSVCIVCTITGLVITVTGVLGTGSGVPLTAAAFGSAIPFGRAIVTIGAILFGTSTILGWAYYGERCTEYLFHERAVPIYRIICTLVIIPGAMLDLHVVWNLADIANAFMAIPNLLSVALLANLVAKGSRSLILA